MNGEVTYTLLDQNTLAKLAEQPNLKDATAYVMNAYEHPDPGSLRSRTGYAQQIVNLARKLR